MAASKHSTKRRKDPTALSFEEIGKLPPEEFADALLAKVSAEKKPILTPKFVEAIEAFVSNSEFARRAALAYLIRPWPETAVAIHENRITAVAFANVYHCLGQLAARYRELAGYLAAAENRLMLALCTREDSETVMREGRKAARHERMKNEYYDCAEDPVPDAATRARLR